MKHRHRPRREEGAALVARYLQSMAEVIGDLVLAQSCDRALEGNALEELARGALTQPLLELGLAEEDDLEELALLGFQVRQEPYRLQRVLRHRLHFVQAHHGLLSARRDLHQA